MTPRTGTFYSWFGGIAAAETGTMQQTFNVTTAGSAVLKFWWIIPLRDATDVFKVQIDVVDVYALESNTAVFTSYQEKTINLTNISAGSHTINFFSAKTANHDHNLALDDVTLTVTSGLVTQDIGLSSGISIYNNSADNTINISNKSAEKKANIAIYDASGRLVTEKPYDLTNTVVISTKGWNSGVYIINIKSATGTISKKVIVK